MPNPLTFAELREQNAPRCRESFKHGDAYNASDWVVAIAEEVGEVARVVKRWRDGKLDQAVAIAELKKELADVVVYVDLMASRLDIDLGEALVEKFNEVSEHVGSPRRLGGLDAVSRMVVREWAKEPSMETRVSMEPGGRRLKRFWLSWIHTTHGPSFTLDSPWWKSGETFNGGETTILAAIRAETIGDARCIVASAYEGLGPRNIEWRFITVEPDDWQPFCDRFPRAPWMRWPDAPESHRELIDLTLPNEIGTAPEADVEPL